ncbi:unnamed protein product [Gongylonema pulchrum]|uniref:START domain-containing protein n=1 Tax=Gongylonema pulchrum TaxID=637853 RepID=A0A3P6PT46_9BILA|nr:unnamed protein product [Gongylonema pulchrum]
MFWSNVRYLPDQKRADALDLYMVCNHNCSRPDVPVGFSELLNCSNVRVGITVAMLCETVVKKGRGSKTMKELTRSDVQCRICYCAQVDPGGWVPASALRIIYKREYPKFLRGFTKYVLAHVNSHPLII